jgi:hypothetical protein
MLFNFNTFKMPKMKKKSNIFFLLLLFGTILEAQTTFDLSLGIKGCSQTALCPIERKDDYLLVYNRGTCSAKGSNLLLVSKDGILKDSIAVKSLFGKNFPIIRSIKVGKDYYFFGVDATSANPNLIFCKVDSSFKLLKKNDYTFLDLNSDDGSKISFKWSEDKRSFYFIYGQTLFGKSYLGKIDTGLNNIVIKNVSTMIDDVFDIVELHDKQGYLISTLDFQYKSDTLFENIQKLGFAKDLHQVHQLAQFGKKYLVIGEKYKDDKLTNEQHDIAVYLLDFNLKSSKYLRIGKKGSTNQDTVDKVAIQNLYIRNSNQFFILGLTFKDYPLSYDSWVNVSTVDSNLNLLGTKYYRSANDNNIPMSIMGTSDNCILFCGTSIPKIGSSTAFITKVKIDDFLTSDEETSNKNIEVKVFPNPVKEEITILFDEYDTKTDAKLELYDTMGRLVYTEKWNYPYQTLNIASLQSGIYFYSIYLGNKKVKIGKLVKE